jgi:hypothetical protein
MNCNTCHMYAVEFYIEMKCNEIWYNRNRIKWGSWLFCHRNFDFPYTFSCINIPLTMNCVKPRVDGIEFLHVLYAGRLAGLTGGSTTGNWTAGFNFPIAACSCDDWNLYWFRIQFKAEVTWRLRALNCLKWLTWKKKFKRERARRTETFPSLLRSVI